MFIGRVRTLNCTEMHYCHPLPKYHLSETWDDTPYTNIIQGVTCPNANANYNFTNTARIFPVENSNAKAFQA